MKAVMISIQPQWVELIATGRKKMELRKNNPTIPVPFKCYIYQTKRKWFCKWAKKLGLYDLAEKLDNSHGKVIGEFTCYAILKHCEMANADLAERASVVRREEILEYANGKEVFGWCICDVVIYKYPKKITDFGIKRPPQSWCYVEEL